MKLLNKSSSASLSLGGWFSKEQRFLRWGILLSLVIHIGLIFWQQRLKKPRPPVAQPLEIVLVNASSDKAPTAPRLLAQQNLDGGGDATKGQSSSALLFAGELAERLEIEELNKKRLQLEAEQQKLLTQLLSEQKSASRRTPTQTSNDSNVSGQDDFDQQKIAQSARIAILSQQVQDYNRRPRKHFDAPSTAAHRYATYIDQWRQTIEATGTKHYPRDAGKTVYGKVQATITIASNGALLDLSINKPSTQAVLNQAVRRITQLSAPFPPFPPDMARQIDQIVITRTWHFVNGTLDTRQP